MGFPVSEICVCFRRWFGMLIWLSEFRSSIWLDRKSCKVEVAVPNSADLAVSIVLRELTLRYTTSGLSVLIPKSSVPHVEQNFRQRWI